MCGGWQIQRCFLQYIPTALSINKCFNINNIFFSLNNSFEGLFSFSTQQDKAPLGLNNAQEHQHAHNDKNGARYAANNFSRQIHPAQLPYTCAQSRHENEG